MTTPRSRRALAAGAAGFAALGATGAYAVMNTLGGNPVVNFTPAAATDGAQSTATSLVDGVTGAAAADTTTTTAASGDSGASGATTTTTPKSAADPATGDRANCDHDGDHQPLDDATAAKVKAAADKAVPNATIEHMGHDRSNPDGYVAMMDKADGTDALVHEDANFTVTKVEDPAPAHGPDGRGHHGGDRGGDGQDNTTPTTTAAS